MGWHMAGDTGGPATRGRVPAGDSRVKRGKTPRGVIDRPVFNPPREEHGMGEGIHPTARWGHADGWRTDVGAGTSRGGGLWTGCAGAAVETRTWGGERIVAEIRGGEDRVD